jgi:hypothetical protein
MRHRILTCKNHPRLRWGCKDIAWSGGYNGLRNLHFYGRNSEPLEPFSDGSGFRHPPLWEDGSIVSECTCPASLLILAPEDALVTKQE